MPSQVVSPTPYRYEKRSEEKKYFFIYCASAGIPLPAPLVLVMASKNLKAIDKHTKLASPLVVLFVFERSNRGGCSNL